MEHKEYDYKFELYGEPVAQGRPRFSNRGGHVRAYDPKKSRDYKTLVREAAEAVAPDEPTTGAFRVDIYVYRPIPKSFSKVKRLQAIEGEIYPTTRPDTDNYVKGVLDAINGLFWHDDSQIVFISANKLYSETPKILVIIYGRD